MESQNCANSSSLSRKDSDMKSSDEDYKEFLRQFEPRDVRPFPESSGMHRPSLYLKSLAVAAALVMAAFVALPYFHTKPAVLEDAAGKRKIAFGEVVHTHNAGAIVVLADGSRVEIRS